MTSKTTKHPDDIGRIKQAQMSKKNSLLRAQDKTMQLITTLHSTLDIKHVILFFTQALISRLHCEGVHYEHHPTHTTITLGKQTPNRLDYQLKIDTHYVGDISIMRSNSFTEAEIFQIDDLLVLLLNPLNNAITYTMALESARHDPLTGLHNRITLDDELNREIKLSLRHQQPLCVLMLDLDNFKDINDQYGHLAGDIVLKNFADILKSTGRETDLKYRLGGEEFLIVLTNTDINGAKIIGERIRVALASTTSEFQQHHLKVTTSVGIANLDQNDNIDSFLNRADQALYRAKQEGKNRISV